MSDAYADSANWRSAAVADCLLAVAPLLVALITIIGLLYAPADSL